jgi:uncharacterized membrane-anchored protein
MKKTNQALLRVPQVTFLFWVIKILSTTVGETAADYLSFDLKLGMPLVTTLMSILFAALLYRQFAVLKRYVPSNYWLIVVLTSILGTLVTDILVDDFGVSLVTLSVVFTVAMLGGFYAWHRREHTLSIHSIDSASREAYYWVVILLAFALGTGVGDLISEGIDMGYMTALLIFSATITAIAVAHYVFKMNVVLTFWLAFVLTRPLGASLGDLLTQSPKHGGLGIDSMLINIIFFVTIALLIGYLSIKQKSSSVEQATA